jgi:hypothetical protein
MAPLRISVDVHGGPAAGGRLLDKDGSPNSPKSSSICWPRLRGQQHRDEVLA